MKKPKFWRGRILQLLLHYTVSHNIIANLKSMFHITLLFIWLPFLTIKLYFLTLFQAYLLTTVQMCFWMSHSPQTPILSFLHRSHYREYFRINVLNIAMLASQLQNEHSSEPTDFQNFTLLVFEARVAKIQDG